MADLLHVVATLPPPPQRSSPYTVTRASSAEIAAMKRAHFGDVPEPPGQVVNLALRHGAELVGFAQLGLGDVAQVAWLGVSGAHWGTGAADVLTTAALHVAHQAGYSEVHALVKPGSPSHRLALRVGAAAR